ncbi:MULTISPECIES: hypothetical protein [unclassified Microcoleus]
MVIGDGALGMGHWSWGIGHWSLVILAAREAEGWSLVIDLEENRR